MRVETQATVGLRALAVIEHATAALYAPSAAESVRHEYRARQELKALAAALGYEIVEKHREAAE